MCYNANTFEEENKMKAAVKVPEDIQALIARNPGICPKDFAEDAFGVANVADQHSGRVCVQRTDGSIRVFTEQEVADTRAKWEGKAISNPLTWIMSFFRNL